VVALRFAFFIFTIYFACLFTLPTRADADPCTIPAEAQQVDTSISDTVVGAGTPGSCTAEAFIQAVAQGGVITFDCGPHPVTITLNETAKIFNNTGPGIVIDGGNKVTLSGGGAVRILYMNTCDPNQVWTTDHCQNQDHPQLTVQNLTFSDGNATGLEPDGGGAIFVRGGRFKILHCRFVRNTCDPTGPDVGGAAVRVLSQYEGLPVYVVDSVFGGAEDLGNVCSNGGGLSSIAVSYTVINSLFSYNRAIGYGANPNPPGTPGGGSGGAIYNDGNTFTLSLCGTAIHHNHANEGGGAIFFVSNNHTGTLEIENSALWDNPSDGFETAGFPGIFYLGSGTPMVPVVTSSVIGTEPAPHHTAIDVNGDHNTGLAEIIYSLQVISSLRPQSLSPYVRKHGDIVYDHEIDLLDVITGLKILADQP
jgi:hypothetical protein